MSPRPNQFESAGSSHIIPGAYSRISSVQGAVGIASTNNGIVMGSATGGEPTTVLEFFTLADAVRTLRSGPAMDAVRLAFNPGGGLESSKSLCYAGK